MKPINFLQINEYINSKNNNWIYEMPHEIKEDNESYTLIDIPIGEYKRKVEILIIKENVNIEDFQKNNKDMYYLFEVYMNKDNQLYFKNKSLSMLNELMREYKKININKYEEISNDYSQWIIENSEECILQKNAIAAMTENLYKTLIKNNKVIKPYNIDLTKQYEESELDVISQDIYDYSKKIKLNSYNDCDVTPFIINDKLVYRDSASSRTFVCDYQDKNNLIWYAEDESLETNIPEDLIDLYYDANQNYDNITNNLNKHHKVLEYKNGEIIFANNDIYYIKLTLYMVKEEMIFNNEIDMPKEMSFERLLYNHTLHNDYYKIEQRSFIELLSELYIEKNQLTYKYFEDIDDGFEDKINQEKKLIKLNFDTIKLSDNFKPHHYEQISQYLNKLIIQYYEDENINDYKVLLENVNKKFNKNLKIKI